MKEYEAQYLSWESGKHGSLHHERADAELNKYEKRS